MVQRIQTIFLALTALFHLLIFFIPIFTWEGIEGTIFMTAANEVPLIIFSVLIILVSLFVITQYKNRARQRKLVYILTIIIILLVCLCMYSMFRTTTSGDYSLVPIKSYGMFLQLSSIILCLLAARRIKKDDDLVKSIDRIR